MRLAPAVVPGDEPGSLFRVCGALGAVSHRSFCLRVSGVVAPSALHEACSSCAVSPDAKLDFMVVLELCHLG